MAKKKKPINNPCLEDNTKKLEVGQIFNNYKEIREFLGEDNKGGDSKIAQLKGWNRYFSYDMKGHKFIIEEIYSVPLPENTNITQHAETLEKLLISAIVTMSDETSRLYISKNKLYELLHVVNSKYTKYKYAKILPTELGHIPQKVIEDFYATSDSMIKYNVESALKRLANQSLIIWGNVFTVVELEDTNDCWEDSKVQKKKKKYVHREATAYESDLILSYQAIHLKRMGYNDLNDIMWKGNIKEQFYSNVLEDLERNGYSFIKYYPSFSITFSKQFVQERYDTYDHLILNGADKNILRQSLNEDIVNTINKNGIDRHNKAEQNKGSLKYIEVRQDTKYPNHIEILSETLVKVGE